MTTTVPQLGRLRRILIIKPSSLGDIVHALPVLAALRRAAPRAHIAWLVNSNFAPLLQGHPLLSETILFDRAGYGEMLARSSVWGEFGDFVLHLRRRRFDLVIDLQGLFRSAFLTYASGARRRVGFADGREFAPLAYNLRVHCPRELRHAVDRNLRIAAALGLDATAPEFPLGLRLHEMTAAQGMLNYAAGGPIDRFIAVVPGARWSTKQWRADRLAELIDRLHADGRPPCVLLGSADERAAAEEIVRRSSAPTLNLVGRSNLRELAALLHLSERVICHDSGPMHLAAALGKPTVALFGPTDPRRCGPYHPRARVVQTRIACAPCYLRTCSHHSCMERLSVDTVLEAIRTQDAEILGRPPAIAAP